MERSTIGMKNVAISLLLPLVLVAVFTLGAVPPLMADDSYTIPLGEVSLVLAVVPFDAKKHEITECKGPDWSAVCLIDGKPVFGTDWEIPKSQLVRASLKAPDNIIELDVSCMYNPWFTKKPDPRDFSAEKVEGGYRIRGFFSDAAGSYNAEWLVIKDSSVRTRLETAAD
jgi:hypothetical protein